MPATAADAEPENLHLLTAVIGTGNRRAESAFCVPFSLPTRWMLSGQPWQCQAGLGPASATERLTKTTVFSLIERFYEPDSGRVLLDGTDVRDWRIAWLRAAIGYGERPERRLGV